MTLPPDVFKPLRAALGSGRIDDVLACLEQDGTVVVQLGTETFVLNGDALRNGVQGFLSAFESLSLTAVSRSLSDSSIAEEAVFSGNHVGSWEGIEPTHQRVRFNVRLVAEPGGRGPLHSLWVEPDHHALLAQIADNEDILGVTGGLVAAARERAARPVWVTGDSSDSREPSTGPSRSWSRTHITRRTSAVTASMLLLGAVAAAGVHAALPSGSSQSASSAVFVVAPTPRKPAKVSPSSTHAVKVPPKKQVPKGVERTRQPVIATAAPKSVPKVQAGKQLVLSSDVLFSLASSQVTPAARTVLLKVAQQMRNARVKGTIQINGYTDVTGDNRRNVTLSRTRALAVARVLQPALSGLQVILAPQGFGEANPIASNSTPVGQARNRRVTIVLPRR